MVAIFRSHIHLFDRYIILALHTYFRTYVLAQNRLFHYGITFTQIPEAKFTMIENFFWVCLSATVFDEIVTSQFAALTTFI